MLSIYIDLPFLCTYSLCDLEAGTASSEGSSPNKDVIWSSNHLEEHIGTESAGETNLVSLPEILDRFQEKAYLGVIEDGVMKESDNEINSFGNSEWDVYMYYMHVAFALCQNTLVCSC